MNSRIAFHPDKGILPLGDSGKRAGADQCDEAAHAASVRPRDTALSGEGSGGALAIRPRLGVRNEVDRRIGFASRSSTGVDRTAQAGGEVGLVRCDGNPSSWTVIRPSGAFKVRGAT